MSGATLDRVPDPVADNQDADLIALCDEHIANLNAFAADASDLEDDENPLWAAWNRTGKAITSAKPQTLAGLCAKARAALAEASPLAPGSGADHGLPEFCFQWDQWAWQVLCDLLRINGEATP